MKNILIPTDFSENAWNALQYGISFFDKSHCVFHIVHVCPRITNAAEVASTYISTSLLEETMLAERKEKLAVLTNKIAQLPLNSNHEFKTLALHGFLTDVLKNEVRKKEIDLIIMGTKGSTGLKAVSIGSNTGNVITKVPCTVLAVPEEATYQKIQEIGFPSDFQLKYELRILDTVKDILLLKKSAVRFLFVSIKKEEMSDLQLKNKSRLLAYFKDIKCSFHVITGKNIDESIQYFTERQHLDMLVMVAKNLNFLERILFRPTVEKISYHIKTPFLVIHE